MQLSIGRLLLVAFPFCLAVGGSPVEAQDVTLRGRVAESESQGPVPEANVLLRRGERRWGTSTDSTGGFRIRVPRGTYRLQVSALGYRPHTRFISIAEEEERRVDIALSPKRYALNEIRVEGRQQAEAISSTLQRVSAPTIEQQDATAVSDLAPIVPAAHAQTNSRGQTILYFRNAGDRQVGQFFDGALLNVPWDNRVDVSLIPASVVEELTVAKGVPSVRYGANVLGGAINFQSRTLDAPGRRTELRGEIGTAAHRRTSVTHLGRTDEWDYTAAVEYATRGDQPLARNADLKNNQPSTDRRVNTDRRFWSGFGRVGRRFDQGTVGLSVLHVDAKQGVAPEGNVPDAQTRYWRYPLWRKSVVLVSGSVLLGTKTSLRGAVWGSRFAQDIAQYRSINYEAQREKQENRDLTTGFRLLGTQDLSVGRFTLALNGLISRHGQTNVRFPEPETAAGTDSSTAYRQHIFSAGGEYEVQLHPRVEAIVGANVDGTATPNTGPFPTRDPFFAWGVTTGVRVDAGEGWSVRGATGRKSRFPTMRELFGAALGKFVPNPGLSPVTAWIGEVGAEYQTDWASVEATAFLNRVYDTIDKRTFQTGPNAGKEQRVNLEGARIYGIETAGHWNATERLRLRGSVTWSRPRSLTRKGTKKLDEKPGVLGTGAAMLSLPFGVSVMAQAEYTGRTFARNERNAFVSVPSALILDGRLRYDLSTFTEQIGGELYLRGDNLTDDARFVGLGLPGPGRRFRVGVKVSL